MEDKEKQVSVSEKETDSKKSIMTDISNKSVKVGNFINKSAKSVFKTICSASKVCGKGIKKASIVVAKGVKKASIVVARATNKLCKICWKQLRKILIPAYNFSYSISLKVGEFMVSFFTMAGKYVVKTFSPLYSFLYKHCANVGVATLEVFRKIAYKLNVVRAFKELIAKYSKEQDSGIHRAYLRIVGNMFRSKRFYKTVFNYSIAIASVIGMISVVNYFNSLTFALAVEVDGEQLGYVSDESVFEQADKLLQERIIYLDDEVITNNPVFILEVVDANKVNTANEICDNLIKASSEEILTATGIYIDGKFSGAVEDTSELQEFLDGLLAQYSTDNPNETVSFTRDIQFSEGLYPTASIIECNSVIDTLSAREQQELVYITEAGDSPLLIANKNEIDYSELMSLNPGIDVELYPGDEILIQRPVAYLGVQVEEQIVYTETLPYESVRTNDSSLTYGTTKTTVEGQEGEIEITANIITIDGIETERDVVSTAVLKEPVKEEITVGTKVQSYSGSSSSSSTSVNVGATVGSGNYVWPVGGGGGYVSVGLWGYWNHTGMDIAGIADGTPIYAVDAGVVVASGWHYGGFGYYIIIDHGNGVTTLYAHNSFLNVSVGQSVSRGQQIAGAGRTGNTTGTHLHIEFRVNGVIQNPANYIGYR